MLFERYCCIVVSAVYGLSVVPKLSYLLEPCYMIDAEVCLELAASIRFFCSCCFAMMKTVALIKLIIYFSFCKLSAQTRILRRKIRPAYPIRGPSAYTLEFHSPAKRPGGNANLLKRMSKRPLSFDLQVRGFAPVFLALLTHSELPHLLIQNPFSLVAH